MTGVDTLEATVNTLFQPLVELWNSILGLFVPVLVAFLFALAGYFISKLVGLFIKQGLLHVGLDKWFESTGRHEALGNMSLSYVLGGMAKWALFSLFLIMSFSAIPVAHVSAVLITFAQYIPVVIVAVLIVLSGIVIADIAGNKMAHAKKISWVNYLIPFVKLLIILFFVDAAMGLLNIQFRIAQDTYMILLGGLTLAVSLAVGIAMGFVLRKEAESAIKQFKKNL